MPDSQIDAAYFGITPRPPLGCALLMMDLFRAHLYQHRLPLTHQREAIAMALFQSDRHLSVDDLAALLRERGEHVGKATIYRTLSLMVAAGLARELDFGEGFKRYEQQAGEARHDHLVCTDCGKVEPFSNAELDAILASMAEETGFAVQSRQLKLYGLCVECASKAAERDERLTSLGASAAAAPAIGEG